MANQPLAGGASPSSETGVRLWVVISLNSVYSGITFKVPQGGYMATIRPRVQVLLDEETKAVYDELASLFGISTSRMVASVLADTAGSMKQVIEVMRAAKEKSDPLSMLEAAKRFAVDSRQLIANEQLDVEDLIAAAKKRSVAE
jgi:alcohol dehydrogenase class IV